MKLSNGIKIFGVAVVTLLAVLQIVGGTAAPLGSTGIVIAAGDTSSDVCTKHPNLPQC